MDSEPCYLRVTFFHEITKEVVEAILLKFEMVECAANACATKNVELVA